MEPSQLPGPVRERAYSGKGHTECATADGPVAVPGVEDEASRNTSRLVIEDLRADGDRREVRGRDRAEGTGAPRVRRALLRHMELSVSRGGGQYRK